MKKLFIIPIIIFIFATQANSMDAATITPTPTTKPTEAALNEQINNLKDRIASRVAQLNLVEKRGMIGTVTDISETQMTIADTDGTNRIIDVDELTKFSSPSAKGSFGISDITKGQRIGVLGIFNRDSRHTLARFINVLNLPQVLNGAITSINKDDFSFNVTTQDQKDIIVDVENITKTSSYTTADGIVKSGFSKLLQGQRVTLVGFPDIKNPKHFIPSRLIHFIELPPNPRIILIKPDSLGVTPSTGSGNKLVPLIKQK